MSNIILVGVYDSETSHKVAQTAARLAAGANAQLHVCSVFDESEVEKTIEEGSETWTYRSADDAKAVATRVADNLRDTTPDIDIEYSSRHGEPAEALINEAKQLDACLIVVGNKRMQGVTRFLGSVANTVSHHAPCDVYIVKSSS